MAKWLWKHEGEQWKLVPGKVWYVVYFVIYESIVKKPKPLCSTSRNYILQVVIKITKCEYFITASIDKTLDWRALNPGLNARFAWSLLWLFLSMQMFCVGDSDFTLSHWTTGGSNAPNKDTQAGKNKTNMEANMDDNTGFRMFKNGFENVFWWKKYI